MFSFVYRRFVYSPINSLILSSLLVFLGLYFDAVLLYLIAGLLVLTAVLQVKTFVTKILICVICISICIKISNYYYPQEYTHKGNELNGYVITSNEREISIGLADVDGRLLIDKIIVSRKSKNLEISSLRLSDYSQIHIIGDLEFSDGYNGTFLSCVRNCEIHYSSTFLSSVVRSIREKIDLHIRDLFDDELEISLIKGIVFGFDVGSSTDIEKDLKQLGLTHILVASGANIILIMSVFDFWLRKIKHQKKATICISLSCMVLYVMVVGYSGSIVRAGIFFSIDQLAFLLGRTISLKDKLIISYGCILLFFPDLVFSISLFLSYWMVFAIYSAKKIIDILKIKSWVMSSLSYNFCLVLIGGIISSYYFGTVSIGAILANFLLLWSLELCIPITFCLICFSLFFHNFELSQYLIQIMSSVVSQWFQLYIFLFHYLSKSFGNELFVKSKISLSELIILISMIMSVLVLLTYKKYLKKVGKLPEI